MKQNRLQSIRLWSKIYLTNFISRCNDSFKNKNIYQQTIHLQIMRVCVCVRKQDLALNNSQMLICH